MPIPGYMGAFLRRWVGPVAEGTAIYSHSRAAESAACKPLGMQGFVAPAKFLGWSFLFLISGCTERLWIW